MKNILLILLLGMWTSSFGEDLLEYDYEVDAYYSNMSMFIDLDKDKAIEDGSHLSEADLYTNLALNIFSPNVFLVEAAVHPMGIGGLYFRQNHEDMYDRSKIEEFNWIKAVTAGFEEPYSLSFFVGNMLVFKNKDGSKVGKNRAYVGVLASVGDYSIKDNMAHWDRWVNFEFKLKGTREKQDRDLDWSFRVGSKIHENKDFANTLYLGARRSSIDYKKPIASFLYNSAFSTMVGVTADTFELTEVELMVEKKFPVSWSEKMSFGLGLGYLYTSGAKYRNELLDEGVDNHQIMVRPNLKW